MKSGIFNDLSTVLITPTRGWLHCAHVVASSGMIRPFNHKIAGPLYARGMEVGEAYNQLIADILENPEYSKFKFILTLEDDMIPPLDGMIRLYRNIGDYDGIGGLYWTKGENGLPLMFGDPTNSEVNTEINFLPVVPKTNETQPVYGSGMGFNLWKMDVFRRMEAPWFETVAKVENGAGVTMTQDIAFFKKAHALGMKFAIDTSCRVGHFDVDQEIVW